MDSKEIRKKHYEEIRNDLGALRAAIKNYPTLLSEEKKAAADMLSQNLGDAFIRYLDLIDNYITQKNKNEEVLERLKQELTDAEAQMTLYNLSVPSNEEALVFNENGQYIRSIDQAKEQKENQAKVISIKKDSIATLEKQTLHQDTSFREYINKHMKNFASLINEQRLALGKHYIFWIDTLNKIISLFSFIPGVKECKIKTSEEKTLDNLKGNLETITKRTDSIIEGKLRYTLWKNHDVLSANVFYDQTGVFLGEEETYEMAPLKW